MRRSVSVAAAGFNISAFFFFDDTPTTEIYTLSLHDALPISPAAAKLSRTWPAPSMPDTENGCACVQLPVRDRKSTRLNSSHVRISYAVFCLKKKRTQAHVKPPERHRRHVRHHRLLSRHDVLP